MTDPSLTEREATFPLAEWQSWAVGELEMITDTPQLEAQVLLGHFLGRTRTWVVTHPEYPLNSHEITALSDAIQSRTQGMPLPYILGFWEFYGLRFRLNRHVLIPRPETELLVEEALSWLAAHPEASRGLDIGTGSGCIAIALAMRVANLRLVAVDRSVAALRVASENIKAYQLENRVFPVLADLTTGIGCPRGFHLIVSNPPYIPTTTLRALEVYRWEPTLALDGGEDGLRVIQPLIDEVRKCLKPPGLFLMEINAPQAGEVLTLVEKIPGFHSRIIPDLAGLPRLLKMEIQTR